MLHWLPKKLSKREIFFLQLMAIACIAHIVCLGLYFWGSRQKPLTIKMNMQMIRPGVPVRVVPFIRSTGNLKKYAQQKTSTHKSTPKKSQNAPKKKQTPK